MNVDLIEIHVIVKPMTAARAERLGRELANVLSTGAGKRLAAQIENVMVADVRGPEDET